MKKIFLLLALLVAGCTGLPEGIKPVDHFVLQQYLGRWYEIARLDHSFEQGLSSVSAQYSLQQDGSVRVVNRGYSEKEKRWREIEGKAKFVERADQGFLKVSFFGPFYASYVIVELDQVNYSYALVCGPDKSYLWILARSPQLDDVTRQRLIARAASLGFDTGKLVMVVHDK